MKNQPESKRKYFNIPNLLSGYRLFTFPLILYFALNEIEFLFVLFLIINLITDILDGLIARVFKLQTEFGARLDSIADIGSYILAIVGILIFKSEAFAPHILSFFAFISLYLLTHIVSLIKFGRFTSLHLYSSKVNGYVQGIFFFMLFVYDFNVILYYFTICFGALSFIEHIGVQLILRQLRSNQKGLFWVLKERNNG